MELEFLRNILDELRFRFDLKFNTNSFQLQRQLTSLNSLEKQLIRKKVLEFPYNVGALQVIKILTASNVLSITDYLTNIQSSEEAEAIVNDIIDIPDMIDLLLEVIDNNESSDVIAELFQKCFNQYILDVIVQPELIRHEIISSIEEKLRPEVFRDQIVQTFIKELLSREHEYEGVELTKILSIQKSWNFEFKGKKLELVSQIVQRMCVNHSNKIATVLISQLANLSNVHWFFTLFLIQFLNQDSTAAEEMKSFIKKSFKKFHQTRNIDHLLVTLIVARQFLHYTPGADMTYQNWVKSTIGEMHYILKDQEKFVFILEALQSIISYESDLDIVDIHAKTSISSPRGKNHLVLEYKQMLRTKSFAATAVPETFMDLT